jgi:hypothetical protein
VKYQLVEQAKTIAELFKLGLYSKEDAIQALDTIGWMPPKEEVATEEIPEAHGGVGFCVPSDNEDEEDED